MDFYWQVAAVGMSVVFSVIYVLMLLRSGNQYVVEARCDFCCIHTKCRVIPTHNGSDSKVCKSCDCEMDDMYADKDSD